MWWWWWGGGGVTHTGVLLAQDFVLVLNEERLVQRLGGREGEAGRMTSTVCVVWCVVCGV